MRATLWNQDCPWWQTGDGKVDIGHPRQSFGGRGCRGGLGVGLTAGGGLLGGGGGTTGVVRGTPVDHSCLRDRNRHKHLFHGVLYLD